MELFDALERAAGPVILAPGAALLRGFAQDDASALLAAIDTVTALAPLRHMVTPGGYTMSVATTSCGEMGWTSDAQGYRYAACDPDSGLPWPAMPPLFRTLARESAAQAGFPGFEPDACLINRYAPGARLTLHQDRNERDFGAPIVSVSLGLPATFLLGGIRRTDPTLKLHLAHGDVVVWGGPARLRFHGVLPLAHGTHPMTGACRINLTFRKAS
ncbi:2OG-Fe(II) oxygenase superfamily protein [Methyloversatilis sp. RAC08]|uniref:DNA oxidative demethylase AlkB n=1 Tax=Methyloversatilis sp. RAC08 TaxID=1842540 RepID=UPI00083CDD15|nr:DNA oxidative demethylase AlkB [Methyloversatilis sp. RAC08]AOF81620.1 2OG-Fe(II) oxygenase superfamily protein [Methyloversatilis sp. RAC08]